MLSLLLFLPSASFCTLACQCKYGTQSYEAWLWGVVWGNEGGLHLSALVSEDEALLQLAEKEDGPFGATRGQRLLAELH